MREVVQRHRATRRNASASLVALVSFAAALPLSGCGESAPPASSAGTANNASRATSEPPSPASNAAPAEQSPRPAASPEDETNTEGWTEVNLFRMFDIRENTNRGAANLSRYELRFTRNTGACQVYFPKYQPPEEYDLEADVTRTEGSGSVILGLYAWGRQCRVVIDGDADSGPRTGLAPMNGKWVTDPAYPGGVVGPVLQTGRPSTIVCRVRRKSLLVTCDGRTIVDFRDDPTKLGEVRSFGVPVPTALSVASWKCLVHIPRLIVRAKPVDGEIAAGKPVHSGADKPSAQTSAAAPAAGPARAKTAPPAFEKLPLQPENWAFAFRHLRSHRRAIVDPRATIEMDGTGLRGLVKAPGLTMHLVYRPRLQGDFQGKLQILMPPRGDPDSYQPGGTAVPYVGFRPANAGGREITFSVPAPESEPRRHEFAFERRGSNLSVSLDGQPQQPQQIPPAEEYYLFVHINGPGKVFIWGHQVDGEVGPADFARPEFAAVDLSPAAWVLSRPEPGQGDAQTAALRSESGGLRIDNSINRPLQVHFQRPLRGDFHLLALVDILTRSLDGREQGLLFQTSVSGGFLESGKKGLTGFGLTKRPDEAVVRVDLIRERGEIVMLSDGRSGSSLKQAADGFIGFELKQAGSIVLRHVMLIADAVLDAPATAPATGGKPSDNGPPAPTKKPQATGDAASETGPASSGEIEKRVIQFPAPYTDVAVGGGGEHLIFYLPSQDKLAVLDVRQRKLTQFLSMSGPNVAFAAGADKLIVLLPGQKIIQRWDMTRWELEVTKTLDFAVPPTIAAVGSASQGPVLVAGGDTPRGSIQLLDLGTLRPLDMDFSKLLSPTGRTFEVGSHSHVRVSADGRVFTSWANFGSPTGFFVLVLSGSQPQVFHQHDTAGYLAPSPDGQRIYTPKGIYAQQTELIFAQKANTLNFPLPSVQGQWYLRPEDTDPAGRGEGQAVSVKLYAAEQDAAIVELAGLEARGGTHSDLVSRGVLALDKSLFFVPDAKALVSLPATHDRAIVYTVDLDQQLQRTHVPYLFVASRPPRRVAAGSRLDYQMAVKSKHGGAICKLSSGPDGMEVTIDGHVTWNVPRDGPDKTAHVIVTVTDSTGQQIYHTFSLAVVADSGGSEIAQPAPPPQTPAATPRTLRTWTDATGRFKVQARFVRIDGDMVVVEDEQGQQRGVPLSRLSPPDQRYVREQTLTPR